MFAHEKQKPNLIFTKWVFLTLYKNKLELDEELYMFTMSLFASYSFIATKGNLISIYDLQQIGHIDFNNYETKIHKHANCKIQFFVKMSNCKIQHVKYRHVEL